MLSIPHSLTGAFVASKFPNPLIYVPVAIGLHYLEDWIPHWDVGTGLSNGNRKKSTAFKLELIDLALTAVLIYFFWRTEPMILQIHIWAGGLAGILPDLIEAPRNFFNWEPAITKPFNWLHKQFHYSIPNWVVGITPQVVVVAVIWLLK